ncbi:MAG: hypothetical protein HXX20_20725 [Chloroflexi bacterium]|nr:hypothetical protein [Chloroflexota bacterium]
MSQSNNKVITYVPQSDDDATAEMGTLRRSLYLYTNRLGLNYSLVLGMSLAYQGSVALFIGIRAIRNLPVLNWIPTDSVPLQVIALLAAIIAGMFIQGLLIAEAAQIVWLRRTDRLKTRLEKESFWWWVMLFLLLITLSGDFTLVFFAVTGTTDLAPAWAASKVNMLTFITNGILMLLNLLTLLRSASVMRTSTSEINRKEVEERLKAIADEILLEAGDATRLEAQQVWKKLSADPRKFLPLQKAVLDKIREQHPDFFPASLGGDTWAYGINNNSFAALPPHLHQALIAGRANSSRFTDRDSAHLWNLAPDDLAELIGINLQTYGSPRFINAIDPEQPEFAYTPPADFSTAFQTPSRPAASNSGSNPPRPLNTGRVIATAAPTIPTVINPANQEFADKESFLQALEQQPAVKLRFAQYLINNAAAKKLGGSQFVSGQGVTVFDLFDLLEIQFYYRQFVGN